LTIKEYQSIRRLILYLQTFNHQNRYLHKCCTFETRRII